MGQGREARDALETLATITDELPFVPTRRGDGNVVPEYLSGRTTTQREQLLIRYTKAVGVPAERWKG